MKKYFAFVAILLLASEAKSQIQEDTQKNLKDEIYTGAGFINTRKASSEKATGSMYINEVFLPAKIGSSDVVYPLRYNAYTDEMEVSVNQEIKVVPPEQNEIISFLNNNLQFEYSNYKDVKGIEQQNYLTVLSRNSNFTFYKRERIYLKPESHPTSGYDQYKPAAYKRANPEYYLKKADETVAEPFSMKKKDILKLVPGKEKEVNDFIKKNKISLSEDADLNNLGNFLGSLM